MRSGALIRPTITVSVVLVMHLLLGILFRSERANHFLEPDQIAPTVLYILPTVVKHLDIVPPVPDPVMRAPMLPKLESPRVEIPSSPLDVMAITIPSRENSDHARNDEPLEGGDPVASHADEPCLHRSAVNQASVAFRAPCGRRGYMEAGLDRH